jgi:hypothetical protein
MQSATTMSVEERVLASLRTSHREMDLDELIKSVVDNGDDVRAVDIKIAALGLVSRGTVKLNEAWKLSSVTVAP